MNCFPNENICPMFTIATKEEQGVQKNSAHGGLKINRNALSQLLEVRSNGKNYS